jgi:Ring hydroxylating beta subunit
MSIIMAVSFIRSPGSLTPRRLAAKDVRSRMTAAEHAIPGSTRSNAGSRFAAPGPTIPPSRTRHLIDNLEAAPLENWEAEAKTAFLVYRSHLEADHQLLSGCREDLLRKVNGVWKVARRLSVFL